MYSRRKRSSLVLLALALVLMLTEMSSRQVWAKEEEENSDKMRTEDEIEEVRTGKKSFFEFKLLCGAFDCFEAVLYYCLYGSFMTAENVRKIEESTNGAKNPSSDLFLKS